jgi:hypothetical protein
MPGAHDDGSGEAEEGGAVEAETSDAHVPAAVPSTRPPPSKGTQGGHTHDGAPRPRGVGELPTDTKVIGSPLTGPRFGHGPSHPDHRTLSGVHAKWWGRRTVARVDLRPLAERVDGVDDAVCRAAVLSGLCPQGRGVVEARVAVASFVRRHGEVCELLEAGGELLWLIADGVVGISSSVESTLEDLARPGGELLPVALGCLDDIDHRGELAAAVDDLGNALDVLAGENDLAAAVAAEALEAIAFALVTTGP